MRRRSVILLARAAAIVAAAAALHVVCIAPYRGNLVLREVVQRSEVAQGAEHATAVVLARQNLDDLDRVARPMRLETAWYMLDAANCAILERLAEALDAYTRALRVDDRPELYVNRGMILIRLGRTDAAVADLAKAARFNPAITEQLEGDLRGRVVAAAAAAR
jgi:tetratricopeptide (TPR) repeat protein